MRTSQIRSCWQENRPALGTVMHLADPKAYELAAIMGFDALWMDLEHHERSVESAERLIRATRAGGTTDIIARPAKSEFMRLGRLLEAGATGILYPRCDDADEARQVVRCAKFAPLGERGVIPIPLNSRASAMALL